MKGMDGGVARVQAYPVSSKTLIIMEYLNGKENETKIMGKKKKNRP